MKIEIDHLPCLSISDVIKRCRNTFTLTIGRRSFSGEFITFGQRPDALKIVGRDYEQTFLIVYKPSNLGIGEIPFFVCPETGRCFRKLFFVYDEWRSRYTFEHTYHKCNNKMWMFWDRLIKAEEDADLKRYGKPYYNNRLSKYGKRVIAAVKKYNDTWKHIPH